MYTMQATWDRIEAWLTIHTPELLDNLLIGVDDDDIQEIESHSFAPSLCSVVCIIPVAINPLQEPIM